MPPVPKVPPDAVNVVVPPLHIVVVPVMVVGAVLIIFTVTNCVIPPVTVLQGAESFLRTQYVVFDVNPSVV